jgi:hypothetical protein
MAPNAAMRSAIIELVDDGLTVGKLDIDDVYKCGVVNVTRDNRKAVVERKGILVHQFIEM